MMLAAVAGAWAAHLGACVDKCTPGGAHNGTACTVPVAIEHLIGGRHDHIAPEIDNAAIVQHQASRRGERKAQRQAGGGGLRRHAVGQAPCRVAGWLEPRDAAHSWRSTALAKRLDMLASLNPTPQLRSMVTFVVKCRCSPAALRQRSGEPRRSPGGAAAAAQGTSLHVYLSSPGGCLQRSA